MTTDDRLAGIVGRTRVLLLDFDGPVCNMFAGYPAPVVAEELRALITANGCQILDEPNAERGPIRILRLAADTCPPQIVRIVADALLAAELKATETATPTPDANDVLQAARASGRFVAVVSNNSEEAVCRYLDQHELTPYVDYVSARYDGMHPRLMKPNDHLILRALDALDAAPAAGSLIGDATSDVDASRRAGIAVVGYANKPGKRERLNDAGADAVIESMTELAKAIRDDRTLH